MVTIHFQSTAQAAMHAVREFFYFSVPTPTAVLRSVGRIHLYQFSASIFCFVGKVLSELRPRRIVNAFCQAVVVDHAVNGKIFHTNHAKTIDYLTAPLMREVLASKGYALVATGHCFLGLSSVWGALLSLGKLSLKTTKVFLVTAKESGIFNLLSCRKSSERLKPYVYPRGSFERAKRLLLDFARERDIPLASGRTTNGSGLSYALERPMKFDLDMANFGDNKLSILDRAAGGNLGKSEAIVTFSPSEPRVAGFLTGFDSAKEGFKGQVNTYRYVLQDLGVCLREAHPFLFQAGDRHGLIVIGERLLTFFPSRLPLFKQAVIEPATMIQCLLKQPCLLFGGKQAVLVGLKHYKQYSLIQ